MNPLLPDVKSQYSYIYSVAGKCRHILMEEIGMKLSEAEVGDIAICLIAAMERLRLFETPKKKILVVCSAGVVTAWLLVSRCEPNSQMLKLSMLFRPVNWKTEKNLMGIDFIVSTIPSKNKGYSFQTGKPIIEFR